MDRGESATEQRARERRERQEKLKAEIAELDRLRERSRTERGSGETGRSTPADRRTSGTAEPGALDRLRPRNRPADPGPRSTEPTDRPPASVGDGGLRRPLVEKLVTPTTPDPTRTSTRVRTTQESPDTIVGSGRIGGSRGGTVPTRDAEREDRRRRRDEEYEREDRERQRRIEERKARREAELEQEREAEARQLAQERVVRETSARLITDYDTERARLVADAEAVVGRLSSTDWLVAADPLRAHVFAVALHRVRSTLQPLITMVLATIQKHRTTDPRPSFTTEVFVLELGPGNEAASGLATPTFINFPVDTGEIGKLEHDVRVRAAAGSLTEVDIRPLREAVSDSADALAPTVIHEFTHMALYKSYRNESYPWVPNKFGRSLNELARSLPPGSAEAQRLPKLVAMTNPDWVTSGLAEEIDELRNFADEAPLPVKVICQRLGKYTSTKGAELPSHLMEIVYLQGEDYVRRNLPKGHRVLLRLKQQWQTHLTGGVDADWFVSHGLPSPGDAST